MFLTGHRILTVIWLAAFVLGVGARGQNAPTDLAAQLRTILKVTEVEWVGNTVTKPGTVVRLSASNLLFATPKTQGVTCYATVQESKQSIPSSICRLTMKSQGSFLQAGQPLFVTKIRVNPAKDTVTLELVEAVVDPNTGNAAQPNFKTGVNFEFPKGYVGKADASQIAEVINNLLPAETAQAGGPPPEQSPPPAPQQPAAAAGPPQVELGMTEEQVKSILGPPTMASQPKSNVKIYSYRRQITFQDGKVAAIQ